METMTVKRKDTGNPKIINVGDFDPAKHELLDAPKVAPVVEEKPKRTRRK